jgi:hypothetical protein
VAKSPEMVWDATCNWAYKKNETWIEEPLSLLDSWHRISATTPLTPGSHASEVTLFIDFEN